MRICRLFRRSRPLRVEYPMPPPQMPRHQEYESGGDDETNPTRLRVPSKYDGLPFDLSAVIRYRIVVGTPKRADPRVLATESVRQRASAISESMSPADIDQLAGLLEIELDAVRRTSNPDVHARATQVKVTVPGNLEALVRDYEESTVFAKFGDWRWEREQEEIQRLVGLLRDPLQATAWWLNHSDEISAHQLAEKEIPTLRTVAETFVQVSNVLCHSGEVLGDAYQPMSVADVVARLWTEVDPVARSGLHDVLIEYAEQQNQQAIVEALQDLQS